MSDAEPSAEELVHQYEYLKGQFNEMQEVSFQFLVCCEVVLIPSQAHRVVSCECTSSATAMWLTNDSSNSK